MNYFLDTSVIIDFFRGKTEARKLLSQISGKASLFTSLITYAELIYGARRSKDYAKEKKRVDLFIKDLNIRIIPLTLQTIEIYADIKIRLEKKGERLDEFDLLIAASCMETKSIMVTLDTNHFKRIKQLELLSFKHDNSYSEILK